MKRLIISVFLAIMVCSQAVKAEEGIQMKPPVYIEPVQQETKQAPPPKETVSPQPAQYQPPQQLQPMQGYSPKTFNLLYIECTRAKGKVLGEKLRMEVIVDGFQTEVPLKHSFKEGKSWNLNRGYDYVDYVALRFWNDNVFKDYYIGELREDINLPMEQKAISVFGKDLDIQVHYQTMPGPSYQELVFKLRSALAASYQEIERLLQENETLSDQNDDYHRQVNSLLDRIDRLENKE